MAHLAHFNRDGSQLRAAIAVGLAIIIPGLGGGAAWMFLRAYSDDGATALQTIDDLWSDWSREKHSGSPFWDFATELLKDEISESAIGE